MPDTLLVAGLLSQLCHHSIGWICPDDPVTDCKLESRMQDGMDRINGVDLKPSLFQEIVIELKHIRILDLTDFLLPESIPYEMIVHIGVIRKCR